MTIVPLSTWDDHLLFEEMMFTHPYDKVEEKKIEGDENCLNNVSGWQNETPKWSYEGWNLHNFVCCLRFNSVKAYKIMCEPV